MEEANFHSEISFSESISNKRIQSACRLFGLKTVNRIIGIALFLLGGNRKEISDFLNLPKGTFFSFLNRFQRKGIKALKDQREKPDKPKVIQAISEKLEVLYGERKIVIRVSPHKNRLEIDPANGLQFKTLMLSFMSSGFLSAKEVSEQLGVSERHIRDLSKNLRAYDIEALLDKRRGQQKEYTFTEDIKAEIIQQFVVNLINKRPTVSSQITDQVNEACRTSLSGRAMRQHLSKLGLPKIKESLPKLLEGVKKSSKS
ncbi:MAG: helix-turn-helix domain-containing protein [Desulfobacteraceae bacterium]|nr:helix-turn-helix domain-containing protein [Lentisphaerota bacterium]MCP4110902.1 helix-turn-helix domain-containing protein [Desulfobacteraceae bacterium]